MNRLLGGDGAVLLLQVLRTNDKKALAAEQMFASLQGLLVQRTGGLFGGAQRERLGFEIAVIGKRIGFYVWVLSYLKEFVEEQIYAQTLKRSARFRELVFGEKGA